MMEKIFKIIAILLFLIIIGIIGFKFFKEKATKMDFGEIIFENDSIKVFPKKFEYNKGNVILPKDTYNLIFSNYTSKTWFKVVDIHPGILKIKVEYSLEKPGDEPFLFMALFNESNNVKQIIPIKLCVPDCTINERGLYEGSRNIDLGKIIGKEEKAILYLVYSGIDFETRTYKQPINDNITIKKLFISLDDKILVDI